MTATIASELAFAYPNYLSSKQLGSVITQDIILTAFFRRRLRVMQQCYNMTEIELLAKVESLKEFNGVL